MAIIRARSILLGLAAALTAFGAVQAAPKKAAPAAEIPHMLRQGDRHALIVDGAPFLMLGAQVNNSSNWPASLPKVWPVMDRLHVNTVEVPVSWEQVEPREGQFDFSFLDTLLAQAREHRVRLVLLWFATWKNNGPNYAPEWVKLDNDRFPRVINPTGEVMNSLSPNFQATLDADRRAFVALMRHLRQVDARRTVIMVQVENEVGTYGAIRDHSEAAEALFKGQAPDELVKALGKQAGSWRDAFGFDADEYFHAWSIARFVDQIAEAGKAEYPIPLYVNAALRDPFNPQHPMTYSSGGPTFNVLDIWKAGAPHIDVIGPDIYMSDYRSYVRTLEQYARPDNALFVPETGNKPDYARMVFEVVGRGGIGFSPFGMDATGYVNFPLGAAKIDDEALDPYAANYALLAPMSRLLAQMSLDGKLWGVAEPPDVHEQTLSLGAWQATVSYGRLQFGMDPAKGNPTPSGGVVIGQLAPDEYLIAGYHCRVTFASTGQTGRRWLFARVEEGRYVDGRWVFDRLWNGDQTDYGLNLTSAPQVLRVKLGRY